MHVKLTRLLRTEDGRRLLAGYRRASDILRREEEKDCRKYCGKPDPCLYLQKEERNLAVAVVAAKQETIAAVARDDFAAAMHAVSRLGPIVDAFFAKVMIDVPAADRRENRLKLLNEMREAARAVADFSKIATAPSVASSPPQSAMAEAAAAP
jgi:glycyl-tRNA synthetase beta chain